MMRAGMSMREASASRRLDGVPVLVIAGLETASPRYCKLSKFKPYADGAENCPIKQRVYLFPLQYSRPRSIGLVSLEPELSNP